MLQIRHTPDLTLSLDDLAGTMGATAAFHGHHHCDVQYVMPAGKRRQYGVGMRSIVDLFGEVVHLE
jgi:hypothetical protein